jgi:hypothetical protein
MRDRIKFVPPPWFALGASAILLVALFAAHRAELFRECFPVCGVLIALALYVKRPDLYLQFTLWLWFLTPLVRRVVDLRFGYADQNLVLLCPILVTAVAGLSLLERAEPVRALTPFFLCITGVVYGFVIGMMRHASGDVVYGLFNWLAPILLGLHVYLQWPLYERHKRAIERTFLLGIAVMGLYGIYQYCAPPPWDVYWWESLPPYLAASFGRPVKFEVRVWSTLNAPAPFAGVMAVGLLMNFASRSKWRWICNLAGLGAFMLSLSRTEWLACLVGLIFILYRGSRAFLVKTLAGAVVLVAVGVALLSAGPGQRMIVQRLGSFQHLSQDESVQTRSAMYERLMGDMMRDPFGQGVSNAAVYDGYALDSGPLRFLLKLGMLGTLFYFAGICQILVRLLPRQFGEDPLQAACGAVLLAALAKFISVSGFENAGGAVLWLCIGLGLAARRYYAAEIETVAQEERYAYAN